jgi:DNA polymerase/3'-5' exonuclease PolX
MPVKYPTLTQPAYVDLVVAGAIDAAPPVYTPIAFADSVLHPEWGVEDAVQITGIMKELAATYPQSKVKQKLKTQAFVSFPDLRMVHGAVTGRKFRLKDTKELLAQETAQVINKGMRWRLAFDEAAELAGFIQGTSRFRIGLSPRKGDGRKQRVFIGGSIRRRMPFVKDIDLVVGRSLWPDVKQNIEKGFKASRTPSIFKPQFVSGGNEKLVYRLPYLSELDDDEVEKITHFINVDIWRSDKAGLPSGAFQLFVTGPKDYNIQMRAKAKKKGYKLNQYGLYKDDKFITSSEAEIYRKLGLEYKPPEFRTAYRRWQLKTAPPWQA